MFYLVVAYDRCDRVPVEFNSFDEAKTVFKQLNDPTYTLDCYDKFYRRKILLGKGKIPYQYKERNIEK